ncbi:MAG: hypothetical protein WEF50_20755 [Myxococcota bacterium]
MLSPLDDYPVHQIAEPIRHVATGDRNFYDRYYFNLHACSDELFLVMGLGQYPNLGTTDAFAVVLRNGVQRVVRASRELGHDRMNTRVGPLRIEVIEGLRKLRVVLEPNEWGLAFDLVWDGHVPAHLEARHFVRQLGRVVFDTSRLAQTGCWTGALEIAGEKLAITPDRFWGTRDRSWGVRPVGEPEPPGIRAKLGVPFAFWNYAPMQFRDYSIQYIVQEELDGTRVLEQAVKIWRFGIDRPPEPLGRPDHSFEFRPGTRMVESATLHFAKPDGTRLDVAVRPLLPMHVGVGTGYGFDADWRHGMYQGELVVQGLAYDLAKPEDRAKMFGLVDSVAEFSCQGEVGHGLFEYLVLGPYARYGFKEFLDGAP